jgi:hypothetical protein
VVGPWVYSSGTSPHYNILHHIIPHYTTLNHLKPPDTTFYYRLPSPRSEQHLLKEASDSSSRKQLQASEASGTDHGTAQTLPTVHPLTSYALHFTLQHFLTTSLHHTTSHYITRTRPTGDATGLTPVATKSPQFHIPTAAAAGGDSGDLSITYP